MTDGDGDKKLPKVSRVDAAAILLMSLGEADAAQVLKHMGPKEVQRVGTSMAALKDISQEQVEGVMIEFLEAVGSQTGMGIGSDEYIKNMLTEALGQDKADSLIDRILVGGNTTGLDTLKWMDGRAVAELIRYEHPQIQAIVLSYLESDQAAEVLGVLDEKVRLDVIMRVASLESIQPQALQELNDILEKQFSGNAATKTSKIGGVKCAADIMNFIDTTIEADLMDSIKEVDAELGTEIEELMFVFDNLKDVDDRGIQTLLREVSSDILIVALKGADTELQEKIFKNMSKRAAELLRDDLEAKGPVKVSEVEGAQKEILTIARRLSESGEIALGGSGEAMI
ncbi:MULTISPECIES: flagellar motor switch protein FliG [unclassified Oleiphilus]|jgi:flagellar motor switch protein FliG|nr:MULTISPECIES: flagellar motor switch protein FliG [unclassified Oleiphilus]KZY47149.1 flagellar motor switch protein FliG [Oleiphilus sp. HI0050]KZY79035.1 flagellar motor switch protein FliG [Oleiphilus sp. HI0068]KZY85843.1 flagellar motor switch protein FliG [Oleiphilus sp. HI0069]KZY92923.1 flagellar motor switch protein FliG [Oleiphilus sp. HI0072]KZZ22379.1 flagellar motor switch protein FliG [Oleiphilus sp. HI0081]KZZ39045.1 flagellar motor switch protein FliG [Oleiphilus sp. HI0085